MASSLPAHSTFWTCCACARVRVCRHRTFALLPRRESMNARIDGRPQFDAGKFKETTRMHWEAAAEAWDRWGPFIGSGLGAATEAMLDMAAIAPGARVVDIAAGAGEQTLAAARRVGGRGHVLATRISAAS